MTVATAKVQMATTPWGDDKIKRGLSSTAATYYTGQMICLNASGYAVSASDTTGLVFDGAMCDASNITVLSGGSNGDYVVTVERPWRLQYAINSTVTPANIGSAVYVVDDQTVGLSSSNSILVGWIDDLAPTGAATATTVVIKPLFAPLSNIPVSANTITFTGTTGANTIVVPDNLANALAIEEGSNVYVQLVTTNGSELTKILGPAATAVTNAGGGVQLTGGIGGGTSGAGGTVVAAGGAGTAGNSAGGLVSYTGGAGQGSAAGGLSRVVGGLGGLTGAGGAAQLTGGAGGATSGTGGAATIAAGAGTGTSAAGGAASLTGGASPGASGTAGAASIDAGAASGGTASTVNIADVNAATTYLNRGSLKALQVGLTLTALGTAQSSTPTSAQLLGGALTQTGATGAGTVTLPSGTAVSTACARTPVVGDTFDCYFYNLGGSQTLTITGATGTTVVGTAAVGTGKMAQMKFYNSGSNTWNIYVIVSA